MRCDPIIIGLIKRAENVISTFLFPDDIQLQISTEEKRKRIYVFMVVVILIPVLIGLGMVGFRQDDWLKASWANFVAAGFISIVILIARKSRDGRNAYRFGIAGVSLFLLYILILGRARGGDLMWFYLYPLVSFFLFGIAEGLFWIAVTLIPAFFIILFPSLTNTFPVPSRFVLNFIVSVLIVAIVAGLLESLRLHFDRKLEKQKIELEIALKNVKTLTGLIPICASCKKIRDDKGYWQAVEEYISTHTDALFSHSICEDCLRKSAPEIYQSLVDQGEITPLKSGEDAPPT